MGIRQEIKEMDLDSLFRVEAEVKASIEKKRNEEKIPIWLISGDGMNEAAFIPEDYDQAVDRLCKEIRDFAKRFPNQPIDYKLKQRFVIESEVKNWLALS